MIPVSGATQIGVVSNENLIIRKVLREGVRPSLEQINRWFEEQLTIEITEAANGLQTIQGRIREIGSYYSVTDADALFWIEGHRFGVYVRNIESFKVEEIEKVPFPIIIDPFSDLANEIQIETVTLVSTGRKFLVNRQRLSEESSYFKAMLRGAFQESTQKEIDLSLLLSSQELNLVLLYLDGQIQIQKSNVIDLFIGSDKLSIEGLKDKVREYLIKNLTLRDIQSLQSNVQYPPLLNFLHGIDKEIVQFYSSQPSCPVSEEIKQLLEKEELSNLKQLSLGCRKIIYSGGARSEPHLESNGIIDVLRLVEILGATIEVLNIYNVNDPDLPLLVRYLRGNPKITSLNISWNNIHMRWEGLTDQGAFLLAQVINSLPSLEILKIKEHNISNKGLEYIADALEFNTSVREVDLSCNNFSSEGFNYLAKKLMRGKTIKILCLTGCGIGKGLKKDGIYVQAFSSNTSIRELYIGNNCIDDEGAEGIATIIANNTSLQVVDLWGNRISSEGWERTLAPLERNEKRAIELRSGTVDWMEHS